MKQCIAVNESLQLQLQQQSAKNKKQYEQLLSIYHKKESHLNDLQTNIRSKNQQIRRKNEQIQELKERVIPKKYKESVGYHGKRWRMKTIIDKIDDYYDEDQIGREKLKWTEITNSSESIAKLQIQFATETNYELRKRAKDKKSALISAVSEYAMGMTQKQRKRVFVVNTKQKGIVFVVS